MNKIREIFDEMEKFSKGALLWGQLWSLLAATVRHIWHERNAQWHSMVSKTTAKIPEEKITC